MTQESTFQPQIFDYYNFCVIQNYVFNEPVPVIENSYTYEENGVLYCASATEKGVYCYSYARNNPLHYVAPHKRNSGERYEVSGAGVPCCSWVATSAGDAVAVVRWDFCRLDFFGTFLIKQKSTEENHEHYPMFKIINMNGRLYDPVIARFFSPDKYVMNGSFTQDFNRYSYARNNPLMYTDPDGEWINFVIGAVVGFINGLSQGAAIANAKGATGWAKFGYMMAAAHIGGGIGAGTAGLGMAISSALPLAGAAGGAIAGGVSGLVAGATNGLAMGTLSGMKGNNLWGATWKGGLMGMGMGTIMGGVMGGMEAWSNDANFWTGKAYGGEMGGPSKSDGTFLDEKIPPGTKPTATGEVATHSGNPNYGKYGPNLRNGGTASHYGVDYAGEVGDPVFAMYDGKVTYNGYSKAFGPYHVRTESIINGRTYNVDYGHLSYSSLKKGDWLNAGDLVGLMGREGSAFNNPNFIPPTHVHIAVWRSVVIQGVSYQGFVQPSWIWRSNTIPWQFRLYY